MSQSGMPKKCAICSGPVAVYCTARGREVMSNIIFSILRCSHCKSGSTWPRPNSSDALEGYGLEYYDSWQPKTKNLVYLISWWFRRGIILKGRLDKLPKVTGVRSLIDVGCGDGLFLEAASRLGWEAQGVETSGTACSLARSRGNVVFHGRLREANLPSGSLDVVTLFHVLEHVGSPEETMADIKRILKPDGFLLVEVPNFGSILARVLRGRWGALDVPRHLTHFTKDGLSTLLSRHGFTVDLKTNNLFRDLLFSFWLFFSFTLLRRESVVAAAPNRFSGMAYLLMAVFTLPVFLVFYLPFYLIFGGETLEYRFVMSREGYVR